MAYEATEGQARKANPSGANIALFMSTIAFTVCFAAWVLNGVLVTYLVSKDIFRFDSEQVGLLLALPILTGAISRVPLGIATDKYGGRIVLTLTMLLVSVPLGLLSVATTYAHFVLCSLGFGLAGGVFAVGIGYVSVWFSRAKQGTALGVFGMGNAGAALTTLFAPSLLVAITSGGADPEAWRQLPLIYAALVALTALVFFALTKPRLAETDGREKTLRERLAPLKNVTVWRFGFYYFLVFGAFVALAQWIVPYGTNVYGLTIAQAGLIASAFSLPSGVIRAAGGWLSDRFGALSVMYWVFGICLVVCVVLAVPRMQLQSPGPGINSPVSGVVSEVTPRFIKIGDRQIALAQSAASDPAELDDGTQVLPSMVAWQEPVVKVGDQVKKKQLIARGVSRIYYPANLWIFAFLVVVIGVATGIGKAGVYKFIPDQFPDQVGAVGGMVGLLGAMGGFVLPPLFGYLLQTTGLWSTCWAVVALLSFACLVWMHSTVRRIEKEEAPDLAQLLERRREVVSTFQANGKGLTSAPVHTLLQKIPMLSGLGQEQLKALGEEARQVEFKAGEVIFEENGPGDALYVILTGGVRVHRTTGAEDATLATFAPGEFFGELSLLDGDPRSATATATSTTSLLVVGRSHFLGMLASSPRIMSRILSTLSGRLRQANERIPSEPELQ